MNFFMKLHHLKQKTPKTKPGGRYLEDIDNNSLCYLPINSVVSQDIFKFYLMLNVDKIFVINEGH